MKGGYILCVNQQQDLLPALVARSLFPAFVLAVVVMVLPAVQAAAASNFYERCIV